MSIRFVRADALRNIQSRLIETYGGARGVRDENALESAVARPQQIAHYSGETRLGVLIASLSWALLRNHPFVDGNKRIALAAIVVAADINGHRLDCGEVEETAMILRAAEGSVTEEQWSEWLTRVVVPNSESDFVR